MDEETFRVHVLEAMEGVPKSCRMLALRHYCDQVRNFTPEGVHHCVQLVRLLAEVNAEHVPAQGDTAPPVQVDLPPSPAAKIMSAHLLHKMRSWVVRLRTRLSGSADPPCQTLEDAVPWCLGADETKLLTNWLPPHDLPPVEVLTDLLTHAHNRTQESGRARWDDYCLLYGEASLALLERETRNTARLTGFRQADLAAYVLADTRPCLPAGRVSAHSLYQPHTTCGVTSRSWVVVELYTHDETYEQFRALYRQIRLGLGQMDLTALADEDQAFLMLVQDLGGPPTGRGKKAFWQRCTQVWNDQRGREVYIDWRGPKQRYRRLQQRLETLGGELDKAQLRAMARKLGVDWDAVTAAP